MNDLRRGFTLLEMMLAMSALALVATICYGAFHLGIRAVERGEVAVVTAQRLRVASDVLIRQIKSTVAYPACNDEEEVYPYFVGTATSMSFISAAGLEGGGGLTRVAYQLVENPTRLVIAEGSHFSPQMLGGGHLTPPGDRTAVLLDGFKTLRFQYMMNDGVDTEWRDEWDSYEEEMLPAAVRVLVDGLPGIELDTWGQEIPLMMITGDNVGEVDEPPDGCGSRGDENDDLGNGGTGSGSSGGGGFGRGAGAWERGRGLMDRSRQRGVALILVTWVFMILGVLALDFARYMRDDAIASLNLSEETRNYYVAVGGMNRALYDLEQSEHGTASVDPARPTRLAARQDAALGDCTGPACAKSTKKSSAGDAGDAGDDGGDGGDDTGDDEVDESEGLGAADGQWHEEVLSGARYGVRVTDEGALISLNDAAQEQGANTLRFVVKNLLGYGGASGTDRRGDAEVSTIVDSIVDWYDRNDEEGVHGAETRYYMKRDPPYAAKNGDFDSIEELLQVRGITPELYFGANGMPGMKDVFTPYLHSKGEHPKVSLQRAPAPVLQALLGVDAEAAADLVELREDQDPNVFQTQVIERLRALDPVIAEQIIGKGGTPKVVRVEARADVSVPRNQARVAAIVELTSELTEGARIIRWFDRAPWAGTLPAGSGDPAS